MPLDRLMAAIRPSLPFIKSVLVGASVAYLGVSLWNAATPALLERLTDITVAGTFAMIALLYAGVLLLPALGWAFLIQGNCRETAIPTLDLICIYGTTLVAKYLPGNVFHLIGRQLAFATRGLEQTSPAIATLYEILLVISAGAGVSSACALAGHMELIKAAPWLPPEIVTLALAGGLLLPWATIAVLYTPLGRRMAKKIPLLAKARVNLPVLGASWCCYAAFVATSSALLWLAARALVGDAQILPIIATYGMIYVLSYLTPGAPGGIGVREALTLIALGPYLGEGVAAIAAIGLRLAMMIGEGVLCGLSLALGRLIRQS